MKITTKYNPGEVVWIIRNNKAVESKIYEVIPGKISSTFKNYDRYTLEGYNGNSPILYEYEIFKTKEELLKSL